MSSSPGCAEEGERNEAVCETGDSVGGEQRGREDITLQETEEQIMVH